MPAVQTTGRNGLPCVTLSGADGATAEVYLNGAHVTSWQPRGEEVLFVSERSRFATGHSIRGGIPVIFPQFGPGPLPQHGFVRTQRWTVRELGGHENAVFVKLALTDSPETRSLWPHSFEAELTVTLTEALEVALSVTNTGSGSFDFTAALHTYLGVSDVTRIALEGLRGAPFIDKTRDHRRFNDTEPLLRIEGETDRIYLAVEGAVRVHDAGTRRVVTCRGAGLPDVVVWNPWIDWSREHDDFGNDEYLRMVCVEGARIQYPVRLHRGGRWHGSQILSVQEPAEGGA